MRSIDFIHLNQTLQDPNRHPALFPWHEVRKVQDYWLNATSITHPITYDAREGGEKGRPSAYQSS